MTKAQEMLEFAEAGARHAAGLTAQLAKPDWRPGRAHVEQARNSIEKLAAQLRLAAQADAPGGLDLTKGCPCEQCERDRAGQPQSPISRDEVARIVDPVAFNNIHLAREKAIPRQREALQKADAILALSRPLRGGEA